jgi:Tfp pilus assembly protein PilO
MSGSSRRKMFWAAGLLAAANVAAYVAYTLPRSLQKRNVASRVDLLKVELAEERTRTADLRARSESIVANRTESRSFLEDHVARPGTSLVPILKEVETLAKEQGLKVGTQGFTREAVKGLPLEKFEISMPVSGTYDQVAGLVQELERSSYFLTLDEIGARQQGNLGEGSVELSLNFSAYFRAGPEGAPR